MRESARRLPKAFATETNCAASCVCSLRTNSVIGVVRCSWIHDPHRCERCLLVLQLLGERGYEVRLKRDRLLLHQTQQRGRIPAERMRALVDRRLAHRYAASRSCCARLTACARSASFSIRAMRRKSGKNHSSAVLKRRGLLKLLQMRGNIGFVNRMIGLDDQIAGESLKRARIRSPEGVFGKFRGKWRRTSEI